MESELHSLFTNLSTHFPQKKVASGEEIRLIIDREVSRLSSETREKLSRQLQGNLEDLIFESITEEPISLHSPDMTAKRNYLGETFYHPRSHFFPVEEMEQAFRQLVEIRALDLLPGMERIVGNFLQMSGYTLATWIDQEEPIKSRRVTATKKEHELLIYLVPCIVFAGEFTRAGEQKVEPVMVVPVEKTPAPFIHFTRNRPRNLEEKGIQIWVTDLEAGIVNPFWGYPGDEELAKNFAHPEQALLAAQILTDDKISRLTQRNDPETS